MPKGTSSEPFKLELFPGNFLTRATVKAHCDPKFLRIKERLGIDLRSDQHYNGSTVFVDSERAYDMLRSDLNSFPLGESQSPRAIYALEQLPSAKKVIEQRASYTDRYNTNYEKILSDPVPTTHWEDERNFTDAVAYFFCLANEEIPPGLFEELMKPCSNGCSITEQTKRSLMLDLHRYTQMAAFEAPLEETDYDKMSVHTRKKVAHRVVMLLKEAAKNEHTRRHLIDTAGEAADVPKLYPGDDHWRVDSATRRDHFALSLFKREQEMLMNKTIAEYSSAVSEPEKQHQQQKLLDIFNQIALINAVAPVFLGDDFNNRRTREQINEATLSFCVALQKLDYLSFGPDKIAVTYWRNHSMLPSVKDVNEYVPRLLEKVENTDLYEIAAKVPGWEAFMLEHDPEYKKFCDEAPTGDNEDQAAKSEMLANRSRHFFSEIKSSLRAVSPQNDHTQNHSIQ